MLKDGGQVNIDKMLPNEGIFAGPKKAEAAAALRNIAKDNSKIISED